MTLEQVQAAIAYHYMLRDTEYRDPVDPMFWAPHIELLGGGGMNYVSEVQDIGDGLAVAVCNTNYLGDRHETQKVVFAPAAAQKVFR